MNDYIAVDKRPEIQERYQIFDANMDTIILELEKEHSAHCPADLSDEGVIIWVDEKAGVFSDNRSLYIYAECQRCMKGGWTSIKENAKYHVQQKTRKVRHATSVH